MRNTEPTQRMDRLTVTGWLAGLAAMLACLAGVPAGAVERGRPVHALAIHGEPMYGPDFTHFGYVNPDAPKGGTLVLPNKAFLTFDTFNPFVIKGSVAVYLTLMHDTLMAGGADEPSTSYCLICETVEVAEDNSQVTFNLRPGAHFSDGSEITAEDVVFSFETLTTEGAPVYRFMWSDVESVEAIDDRTVVFHFKVTGNRELPVILGDLPVLSKAYWQDREFTDTTLEVPVTSGPYTIADFDVGRSVSYGRLTDYWGKDLPVNTGKYNFDTVRVEYFRDDDVSFEAFKRGIYEFRREVTSRLWATAYDFDAAQDGRVEKVAVDTILPMTIQSQWFNLRREKFQDRRVRRAINYAFDFESLNRTQFYGLYVRQRSYWQNSEMEAKGLPGPDELEILEPFRDQVPTEVFTEEFVQPTTDGEGGVRDNLLAARELLREAGYVEEDGKLIDPETGEQFSFEIMIVQASLERVILPYIQNLQRLGIDATLRIVDTSQYTNRLTEFDYDVVTLVQQQTLTPGNEQREYWGSETADRPGSNNIGGVKDPVVDALIEKMINAEDRDTLVAITKAMDRVLQWNYYRVLTYGSPDERYSYWSNLGKPDRYPRTGLGLGDSVPILWWHKPDMPDNAADIPAGTRSAATQSDASPDDGDAGQSAADEEEREDPTAMILIAGIGVILLIWSALRRRHTKPRK